VFGKRVLRAGGEVTGDRERRSTLALGNPGGVSGEGGAIFGWTGSKFEGSDAKDSGSSVSGDSEPSGAEDSRELTVGLLGAGADLNRRATVGNSVTGER